MSGAIAKAKASDEIKCQVVSARGLNDEVAAHGRYEVTCYGPDGKLKWQDTIDNVVTDEGVRKLLDEGLAGSAYTATWYFGLISSVSYTAVAAGDTAAQINGTNTWKEAAALNAPDYDETTRPAAAFSAAATRSKSTSAASTFSINQTGTVKGAFLVSNNTKQGTTGALYSAGLFTGGDKAVGSGDSLNVSYTATLT